MTEPIVIQFEYNNETDTVRVWHDGLIDWEDPSWSSIDQYLRWHVPTDCPVVIRPYKDA